MYFEGIILTDINHRQQLYLNMKKLIVLLILSCFTISINAQRKKPTNIPEYNISWNKRSKSKKTAPNDYLGKDDNGNHVFIGTRFNTIFLMFYIQHIRREYFLIFDEDGKYISRQRIKDFKTVHFNAMSSTAKVRDLMLREKSVMHMGDKTYVVYYDRKRRRRYNMIMQEVNINNKTVGKPIVVFDMKRVGIRLAMKLNANYVVSPKGENILIYYPNPERRSITNKLKEKANIHYSLLNKDLKEIKTGSFEYQFKENDCRVVNAVVSDYGEFAFLTEEDMFSEKEQRKQKRAARKSKNKKQSEELEDIYSQKIYTFFACKNPESEVEHFNFEPSSGAVSSMNMFLAYDQTIRLVGSIRNDKRKKEDVYKDFFTADVSYTGEIYFEKLPAEIAQDTEVLSKTSGKVAKTRSKRGKVPRGWAGDFQINNIEYDWSDSSYIIHGENLMRSVYTTVVYNVSSSGGTSAQTVTVYKYVKGNIIMMKFSKDGDMQWRKIIYKQNIDEYYDRDPGYYVSYDIYTYKNNTFTFFKDGLAFPNNDNKEIKGMSRKSGYFVLKTDATGKSEKGVIVSTKKRKKTYDNFYTFYEIGAGRFIATDYNFTGRKVRTGILDLSN